MRHRHKFSLFNFAAPHAMQNVSGKRQKRQANENCSGIHTSAPFLCRCQPTRADATPMGTPSQLAGDITAPTRHPAPNVRKKSSQYFTNSPLHK
jgi:hypothetical protein